MTATLVLGLAFLIGNFGGTTDSLKSVLKDWVQEQVCSPPGIEPPVEDQPPQGPKILMAQS